MKLKRIIISTSTLLSLVFSGDVVLAQNNASDSDITKLQKLSSKSDGERDNNTKPPPDLNPLQCGSLRDLQAIIPEPNPVYTTSERPEVIFYFPEAVTEKLQGELILNTLDGKKRIYQTLFQLPQTESPGFFSISFPFNSEIEIPEDEPYRWYLKINCQDDSNNNTNSIVIDASIRRLSPNIDSTSTIWYDSAAQLFHQLTETPADPELRQEWSSLLNEIEAQHLASYPFFGSVTILEQ
ncbi:MAG: DUF928 domain-containing protein [Spirulinaceae cyanobacterium]